MKQILIITSLCFMIGLTTQDAKACGKSPAELHDVIQASLIKVEFQLEEVSSHKLSLELFCKDLRNIQDNVDIAIQSNEQIREDHYIIYKRVQQFQRLAQINKPYPQVVTYFAGGDIYLKGHAEMRAATESLQALKELIHLACRYSDHSLIDQSQNEIQSFQKHFVQAELEKSQISEKEIVNEAYACCYNNMTMDEASVSKCNSIYY